MCRKGKRADAPRDADEIGPVHAKAGRGRFLFAGDFRLADDPFRNRTEDFLNKALKAGIGSLPVVGSALAEFFNFVVVDPAQERRDDFLRETMQRLLALQQSHDHLSAEALRENEAFQATMLQAARLATSTASSEKRVFLQNAVLNSAIGTIDENVRQIFLEMIESMTQMHVVLLKFLDDPKASPEAVASAKSMMMGSMQHVITAALPDVMQDAELFRRLVGDLYRFGLTTRDSFGGMQSGGDSMLNRATTQIGRGFLNFIEKPD
jgi:hypothetical protein